MSGNCSGAFRWLRQERATLKGPAEVFENRPHVFAQGGNATADAGLTASPLESCQPPVTSAAAAVSSSVAANNSGTGILPSGCAFSHAEDFFRQANRN